MLLEVKGELKHGEFQRWVETNCRCSYSQAKRYMAVSKKLADKPFDPSFTDLSIDAFLGYEKKPQAAPPFAREDAEYALKIHALAERGVEGEKDTAKSKLNKLAKDFGMTSEELVKKSEKLCPGQWFSIKSHYNR